LAPGRLQLPGSNCRSAIVLVGVSKFFFVIVQKALSLLYFLVSFA
jgi:hypothetical protein